MATENSPSAKTEANTKAPAAQPAPAVAQASPTSIPAPPKPDEAGAVSDKHLEKLEAAYKAVLAKVQACQKAGIKLEQTLLVEVKAKVKAQAGDLQALIGQKREAGMALEKARAQRAADLAAAK